MANTLPTRSRFVLVQGVLMYGVGLSVVFTIAMNMIFEQAEWFSTFLIGLAVLIPIGVLWSYFMYEFVARRHALRMAQQRRE
ncbi:MAG: hypothetical protein KDC95_01320 [Planctomycetes bacterium]|nr:hypothetical protein [Planctomycetota bacterium]